MFDLYRRGGNVAGVMGSGIGLAGSRRIVEQHCGYIDIESAEVGGTSVVVSLPAEGQATTSHDIDGR